jgi:hypothetical protein
MTMPDDPLKGVSGVAVAIHELFTGFQRSGFTDAQALYLAGKFVEGLAAKDT